MLSTFQRDDFAGRIHDGRIGRNGAPYWVGRITEVQNDDLCRFTDLLSNTDKFIRLHRKRAEADVGCINSNILKLKAVNKIGTFNYQIYLMYMGASNER